MFRQILNHCRSFMSSITTNRRLAMQPVRVLPAIGLLLAATASTNAQDSMMDDPPGGQDYYHVQRPYNVEHGHWQHHSSTYQEGVLRGMSSYIQALGVAHVNHAQAAILEEQAEWAAYENVKKRIETFNDRRRMHRERNEEDREYARLQDEEGKALLEQRQATEYRDAYRLSFSEFNRTTGEIYWPEALQSEAFAAERAKLNKLFAHRSEYKLEKDHYIVQEIEAVQTALKKRLRSNREQMPHQEYVAAQAFLRGLLYEVKYS